MNTKETKGLKVDLRQLLLKAVLNQVPGRGHARCIQVECVQEETFTQSCTDLTLPHL